LPCEESFTTKGSLIPPGTPPPPDHDTHRKKYQVTSNEPYHGRSKT